jgi:hypothetical protein
MHIQTAQMLSAIAFRPNPTVRNASPRYRRSFLDSHIDLIREFALKRVQTQNKQAYSIRALAKRIIHIESKKPAHERHAVSHTTVLRYLRRSQLISHWEAS